MDVACAPADRGPDPPHNCFYCSKFMWLRCIFAWALAALVYGAFFKKVGTASCPFEQNEPLCDAIADIRLLALFILSVGLCRRTLCGHSGESSGSMECSVCPEKVQLYSLSL